MNSDSKPLMIQAEFSEAHSPEWAEFNKAASRLAAELGVDGIYARQLLDKLNGLERLLEDVAGKINVPRGKDVAVHAVELTDSYLSPNGPEDALSNNDESQLHFALAYCCIGDAIKHLRMGDFLSAVDSMVSVTSLLVSALQRTTEEIRSKASQAAAEARHNAPGGSREKRDAIRAAWASGKYTSRDICAEQECGALGISFSTARKALRNTPGPT